MYGNNVSASKIIEEYLQSVNDMYTLPVIQRTKSRLLQFNKIADEKEIDLINVDKNDAIIIVENMDIISHSYLSDIDNTLIRFLDWCFINGYRKEKAINRFGYDEVDLSASIGNTHFKSALDFSEFIDKYYEPLNMNSIENSHRIFLWLIFLGVDTKDILSITKKDVVLNKSNHYLLYNGKKIEIPFEALRTFEYALTSYSFVKTFRNGYKIIDYANPEGLIGYSGARPFQTIQHYINLKQLNQEDNGKLRFNVIFRSGLYYRIYLKENVGIEIDFLQEIQNNYKLPSNCDIRYFRRLGKYLKSDYIDWKKAFYC